MRKKLKKRFINKIKRKGQSLEDCLLYIKLSDSLEEAYEMKRLQKPNNQHKIEYIGPHKWMMWEMWDIVVKATGRKLGSTTAVPNKTK